MSKQTPMAHCGALNITHSADGTIILQFICLAHIFGLLEHYSPIKWNGLSFKDCRRVAQNTQPLYLNAYVLCFMLDWLELIIMAECAALHLIRLIQYIFSFGISHFSFWPFTQSPVILTKYTRNIDDFKIVHEHIAQGFCLLSPFFASFTTNEHK